jgi:hypothetical protein
MDIDWNPLLVDQVDWHWQAQLRPRLDGLDDKEYFWEPVADCWSILRRGENRGVTTFGGGDFVIERAWPNPTPAPVTTIAWRLAHIIVGCLGVRVASQFGGPPVDHETFEYAGTAWEALAQLDDAYARWIGGVRGLGDDGLARPCGPAEGPFADLPLAALVLHIHREVLHHGAEIALLRDLYLRLGKD